MNNQDFVELKPRTINPNVEFSDKQKEFLRELFEYHFGCDDDIETPGSDESDKIEIGVPNISDPLCPEDILNEIYVEQNGRTFLYRKVKEVVK